MSLKHVIFLDKEDGEFSTVVPFRFSFGSPVAALHVYFLSGMLVCNRELLLLLRPMMDYRAMQPSRPS